MFNLRNLSQNRLSFNDMLVINYLPIKEMKIMYMVMKHFTENLIAKYVHVSKTTIQDVKRRMQVGRYSRLNKRISKIEISKDEIEGLRYAYPHLSDARIAQIVSKNLEIQISRSTINRVEHILNFHFQPPKIKQNLTQPQIQKRILFSRRVLIDKISGDDIIFSDESRFVLGTDNRWVWRRRGEEIDEIYEKRDKFPESVMIFAAVGKNFKSQIMIVQDTIGANDYQQLLSESRILEYLNDPENCNLLYQQDNATCHTASVRFIRKYCSLLGNWPPNSPDLNIIENIWAILKKAVEEVNPPTSELLIDTIKSAWDSIPITMINKIVSTFEKRCALVLKMKGNSINYHFNDDVQIPHGEEVFQLYGQFEDEYDTVILPKFTEEEVREYEESINELANEPSWNKQLDSRLIKYIIKQNLSYKEAARRLHTTNVESVQKHMIELLQASGIET